MKNKSKSRAICIAGSVIGIVLAVALGVIFITTGRSGTDYLLIFLGIICLISIVSFICAVKLPKKGASVCIIIFGALGVAVALLSVQYMLVPSILCIVAGALAGTERKEKRQADQGLNDADIVRQGGIAAGAAGSSKAEEVSFLTADAATSGEMPAGGAAGTLKLDVYDTIVGAKDWKQFRKSASEEDLAVIAVGSRYRMQGAGFFVKAAIAIVGMILSVVIGIVAFDSIGMFALFILVGGYLFFNLLASKLTGYSATYSSCRSKLSAQSRAFVDSLFAKNTVQAVFRQIVLILLKIITIPYQFILMVIAIMIPPARNWAIAHGSSDGAVITLPRGYDIGSLSALGRYYASFRFSDAWEQHIETAEQERLAKFSAYEYTDKYGVRQTAYSDDGKTFYASADKLHEVGTSDDGGKTINLKD